MAGAPKSVNGKGAGEGVVLGLLGAGPKIVAGVGVGSGWVCAAGANKILWDRVVALISVRPAGMGVYQHVGSAGISTRERPCEYRPVVT